MASVLATPDRNCTHCWNCTAVNGCTLKCRLREEAESLPKGVEPSKTTVCNKFMAYQARMPLVVNAT
jgi:hypothetical protein